MKKRFIQSTDAHYLFFDRDISWLSFNERVLSEAQRATVPLLERIKFLAICSSNLDEFYRVRMPAIKVLDKLPRDQKPKEAHGLLSKVNDKILQQQKRFGGIIENEILQELRNHTVRLVYDEPVPEPILEALTSHFLHAVAAYIHVVDLSKKGQFSPENNRLYFAITTKAMMVTGKGKVKEVKRYYIVNIPSDVLSRFYSHFHQQTQYIVFLDDIVRLNLSTIFPEQNIESCHSFKITRDAELNIQDEFIGNLSRKIEKKIGLRDHGQATRFLFEPGMPKDVQNLMRHKLNFEGANLIPGGRYHNLKDLAMLPLLDSKYHYEPWPQISLRINNLNSLFQEIKTHDILLHPPYQRYDTVLRFFNEAAIDPFVEKIFVTLYRVASDSRIASALISAAKNGKKVVVFVELKARFDEANNIKWSKKMKAAGVQIIESIPGLKVHAKLALVKRRSGEKTELLGLLATGNFNEGTAKYYTDHILMTAHEGMLKEAEKLFEILKKRKKKKKYAIPGFDYLLVGQFNLQQRFIQLIDREIVLAKKGLSAFIVIKFNNLEDKVLISKLYEASNAGVKISLVVRGICCLVPGIAGMSENILVKRIIDRYLEHGRVFIFSNNNNPEVYLGSADWMNRNIYRRIEVCFPVYDTELKSELMGMVNIQLKDNVQAVTIDELGNNIPTTTSDSSNRAIRSQEEIGKLLQMPGG